MSAQKYCLLCICVRQNAWDRLNVKSDALIHDKLSIDPCLGSGQLSPALCSPCVSPVNMLQLGLNEPHQGTWTSCFPTHLHVSLHRIICRSGDKSKSRSRCNVRLATAT